MKASIRTIERMTNHPQRLLAAVAALLTLAITGCGTLNQSASSDSAPVAKVSSEATSNDLVAEPSPDVTESAPAEPVAGTGNVLPGGSLVDGSVVSGELTRNGQKDVFKLDLADAREFYVADMQGDGINLQVFSDVDDQPVGLSNLSMSFGTWPFKLTKSGTHRLEIWGDTNVVGTYHFRIATVKVRTFPLTIGMKVGAGQPAGAGTIDVPGSIHRFEFDSSGAAKIQILGGNGTCGAIELEVVDAAQESVASARQPIPLCGFESPWPLAAGSGKYALVVRSGQAKTGSYSFQLVRAN